MVYDWYQQLISYRNGVPVWPDQYKTRSVQFVLSFQSVLSLLKYSSKMAPRNYCFSGLVLQAALLTIILAAPRFGINNSKTLRQISPDVFSCTSSDETTKAICTVVLDKVNSELEKSRISIQKDGVLFKYKNKTSIPVDTGHSCTRTAKVTGRYLSAHFLSSASISFSGLSLTEPAALVLNLPVSLQARYDMKQSFGIRRPWPFKGCQHLHGDEFKLHGETSSPAQLVVGFYLSASLGNLSSGDYVVMLRPRAIVMFNLKSTNIDLHISGVNLISGVLSTALGLTSSGFKALEHLYQGEFSEAEKVLKKGLVVNVAIPFILGIGRLPRELEIAVWKALLRFGASKIEKEKNGVVESVENKLNAELHKALRVDSSGVRTIVVKKDVLKLKTSGAAVDDILHDLPPLTPFKCDQQIPDHCWSCSGNNCAGCGAMGHCYTAAAAHADSQKPRNVKHSKPMIDE